MKIAYEKQDLFLTALPELEGSQIKQLTMKLSISKAP